MLAHGLPRVPPPAPLDWFLYTLAILNRYNTQKNCPPPQTPTTNSLPAPCPLTLSDLFPQAIHLFSLIVARARGSHYTLLGPSKGWVLGFFLEKYTLYTQRTSSNNRSCTQARKGIGTMSTAMKSA